MAEAVADDVVARAVADEGSAVAPAASPEVVVGAVGEEAVADTVLAFSGGRSAPGMVGNACCVATLSDAMARSK